MKSTLAVLILLSLNTMLSAQAKKSEKTVDAEKSETTQPADSARTQGIHLLEEASTEAGSFEPKSQVGLFFALGHTYAAFDKTKGRQAYEAAYQNMRVSIGDCPNRPELVGFVAGDLIRSMVQIAPHVVEQSLPPEGRFRDFAIHDLAEHYVQQKQWNRAIEFLLMLESDEDMTYPARDLLMDLPRSRQDDRDRVFAAVLTAYTKTKHRQVGVGTPEDLGTLVERFWQTLDPALVREAIDELLKQAKNGDGIVMRSPKGTVTFTSY